MPLANRRAFLTSALCAARLSAARRTVVDIHQHTPYSGRTADQLVAHQRAMGVSKTVLLPAGRRFGLAAGAGGNDVVRALAARYPDEFVCFANELPDIPETKQTLVRYLDDDAIGIGEQKFPVECDSRYIDLVASIAQDYDVPVLLHFEHGAYNMGFERFHRVLARWPRVRFIGHAQTWWGNIDKNHVQTEMYPKTPVTPGGLTDRYLADYENMFGDLSAGSGRNALQRDEDHARAFLARHQDKLLFGSDCSDADPSGPQCIGHDTLGLLDRLVPDGGVRDKILHLNAGRVMRL